MKKSNEIEKYFLISEFEEGWGMENINSEEQLYYYCIEALFIPEGKIEELCLNDSDSLEIHLNNLETDDVAEDWYVNLFKISKE